MLKYYSFLLIRLGSILHSTAFLLALSYHIVDAKGLKTLQLIVTDRRQFNLRLGPGLGFLYKMMTVWVFMTCLFDTDGSKQCPAFSRPQLRPYLILSLFLVQF